MTSWEGMRRGKEQKGKGGAEEQHKNCQQVRGDG